jgi:GcrA cell cycle regulator
MEMPNHDRDWSPSEIETLQQNWQWKSASQIAVMLENRTRNSVIGQVNRLRAMGKMPARMLKRYVEEPAFNRTPPKQTPIPRLPKPRNNMNEIKSLPVIPPPLEIEDAGRPVILVELEDHHCRWPLGDPREPGFGFCARARVAGMPYCPGHCAIAYNHQGKAA